MICKAWPIAEPFCCANHMRRTVKRRSAPTRDRRYEGLSTLNGFYRSRHRVVRTRRAPSSLSVSCSRTAEERSENTLFLNHRAGRPREG